MEATVYLSEKTTKKIMISFLILLAVLSTGMLGYYGKYPYYDGSCDEEYDEYTA